MGVLSTLLGWSRGAKETDATPGMPLAELRASVRTHPGMVRAVNQDAALFYQPEDLEVRRTRGCLLLVADGLGGEQGGEIASEMCSRQVMDHYYASSRPPGESLRRAVESAGAKIFERAGSDLMLKGMATTCVALALNPPYAWIAWVGDSRLYLLRGGGIFQMTEDHSLVQELVRRGELTPRQASMHADRNVITRSLGTHSSVEVSVWDQPYPVRAGDRILLCSDGLHSMVSAERMLQIASNKPVDMATALLIEEANRWGGPDNISAVLVEVGG